MAIRNLYEECLEVLENYNISNIITFNQTTSASTFSSRPLLLASNSRIGINGVIS